MSGLIRFTTGSVLLDIIKPADVGPSFVNIWKVAPARYRDGFTANEREKYHEHPKCCVATDLLFQHMAYRER